MTFKDLLELKENWRYLFLVVWLLVGVSIIPFLPVVGIFIFLPLLAFLMFLFLLSLISKKHIEEYSDKQIILTFFVSLPLMLIISVVLFILFVISIFVYFILSSWFIIYGCYITSKYFDEKLERIRFNKFFRGFEFFGGSALTIFLLIIFFIASILYSLISTDIPLFLNAVYLVVGIILLSFGVFSLIALRRGILSAWLGVFNILIVFYTFYLTLKVFLGLGSSGTDYTRPLEIKILLVGVDIILILYSVSTLIGSNAKLLSEKIRFVGLDTVFIGLIFSKVAYEFAVNFPYSILKDFPLLQNIPYIEFIVTIGSDISLLRNIAVLVFFLLLLIFIGSYELRKYIIDKQKAKVIEVVEQEQMEEIVSKSMEEQEQPFQLETMEEGEDTDQDDFSSLEEGEFNDHSPENALKFKDQEE